MIKLPGKTTYAETYRKQLFHFNYIQKPQNLFTSVPAYVLLLTAIQKNNSFYESIKRPAAWQNIRVYRY